MPDSSVLQSPASNAIAGTAGPAVSVDRLSVEFPLLSDDSRSLRSTLLHLLTRRRLKPAVGMTVRAEALKRISLEAWHGDRIALIGRNGAGKSTLLKVLAGIYHPTGGRLTVTGRVAALLGGSLGLDDDLSGWEAMDIGCLLLGLRAEEIRERREEIAEFTELGGYLDMPMRTYSAGMRVRLAFGIATSVRPDVLLIDEVLGAGDAHFVEKAKQRMVEMVGAVPVVFMASHSSDILRAICTRAILIDGGEIVCAGGVDEVLEIYHKYSTGAAQMGRSIVTGKPSARPLSSASGADSDADMAFDGDVNTRWLSAETGEQVAGKAWLGIGYSEPVEAVGLSIRQWNGASRGNMISALTVQQSDDAFDRDVREVGHLMLAKSLVLQVLDLPPAPPARGWRVMAMEGTDGGAWGVGELSFLRGREFSRATMTGRPVGNGYTAHWDPSHAFDGKSHTMWVTRERGDEVAERSWIGVDYGSSGQREIRRVMIRQWDGGARPNLVRSVLVQASDDGFGKDVRDIAAFDIAEKTLPQLIHLPPSRPACCWRIRANSPTRGGHWGVTALELDTSPEPEIAEPDETILNKMTPIASGQYRSHAPKQAYDGRIDTFWMSAELGNAVAGSAYIGLDIGAVPGVEMRGVVIQQATGGDAPEFVGAVLVQASDDGFEGDIRNVAELTLPPSTLRQGFDLPESPPARYWRLLAAEGMSQQEARWAVANLEWIDRRQRRVAGIPCDLCRSRRS